MYALRVTDLERMSAMMCASPLMALAARIETTIQESGASTAAI